MPIAIACDPSTTLDAIGKQWRERREELACLREYNDLDLAKAMREWEEANPTALSGGGPSQETLAKISRLWRLRRGEQTLSR